MVQKQEKTRVSRKLWVVQEHDRTRVLRKPWVVQNHEKTRTPRKLWVVRGHEKTRASRKLWGGPETREDACVAGALGGPGTLGKRVCRALWKLRVVQKLHGSVKGRTRGERCGKRVCFGSCG